MTPGDSAGTSLSVLLCDDNVMLLDALREVVEAQPDLEVVGTAFHAEQAIRLARRHEPDLVVLDVRFPGGGPTVAREIARCSPDSRIVAFSAYDDTSSVEGMKRVGVSEYIRKGVTNREFLVALRRAAGTSTEAL
ncbi:response regulator transcription factor [Streptomyces sp. AK02-01A]|uniref:response regulator n=1 Tax=Streptomyces sp. AK02-01A TaxID=3028648 RepID=UPI0029BC8D9A|nr:response regulator transcription factor [Streptomyces sp. AK02-01A]MDX3849966.1 response regulator transcription factor [Streptomyces sp. AK02-01A]